MTDTPGPEPGQIARDAYCKAIRDGLEGAAIWAAEEAAVRADERGKVIEECARMAERGYWSSALGSEGTGQAIARAIRKLGETHT